MADKLIERIRWWEWYTGLFGCTPDNNPSPGNKSGGLTTIYEKSLGAIAKAGTTALNDVIQYAEQVRSRGFVIMDTPGMDPVSVTGIVAGGANVMAFTTGRGSCFGFKPTPVLKIASNTSMYERCATTWTWTRDNSEPRSQRGGCRKRNLRADPGNRQRRTTEERAIGARRRRIPAVDSWAGIITQCATTRPQVVNNS